MTESTTRMIRKSRIAVAVVALAIAAPAVAVDQPDAPAVEVAPTSHLTCTAPTDAAAIDRMLAAANSPLAGQGRTIVDAASAVGLDPRAILAIAAHETLLETYGPARKIHNPFGLGPHWEFPDERSAILKAVEVLKRYYLDEGRDSAATIGPKWAPIGAENDPDGLNNHWVTGVSTYYSALGGDPSLPMTVAAQDPAPSCEAPVETELDPDAPLLVTHWNPSNTPAAGFRMTQGGDPTSGQAATPAGFTFPLALRAQEPASYANPIAAEKTCDQDETDCAVTISSAPNGAVVAAAAGTLAVATDEEQLLGIGFWIESADGDRFGYSPLREYVEGIRAGVTVTPGQHLGTGTGALVVAWERDGSRINPHALLQATKGPRST